MKKHKCKPDDNGECLICDEPVEAAKHKPGPWVVEESPSCAFDIYTANDSDDRVCELVDGKANASLIAAAPEMKHALQEIFKHTQGECDHEDIESCNAEIKRLAEDALAVGC